ncbi:hypothetical protein [Micromonospora sp. KC723]|uniref:hypothetical protein n=1 Tax=Micromonospora sp. KC723 TaxID=2530381 RepID=UPI0010510344|nr:hypothetical protein [Micromonospora sp. KC723]TDB76100.1 hypothetical protein E1165_08550 [Micromonospora sp. KC723]
MNGVRRIAAVAAVTAVAVVGAGTPAFASRNVGWFYTSNGRDAVFFDADLAGHPGYEKITVCDNTTDGMGTRAIIRNQNNLDDEVLISDPSNNGHCESFQWDMWPEETPLNIWVLNYKGTRAYNLEITNNGVA